MTGYRPVAPYLEPPRFLVPGFPLLLPLAVRLARAARRFRRFRACAITAAVALSAYCGAYLSLVRPSAP
ncbi:hypothetical protein [Streptomyces sp. SID12488]|uniref:hypothetical protein n=1 Tax=Streptomyces sp. SID12488 TaxID=2706040 RepID=UPI0013DA5D63|nr:hypothetical protein [Streptomyces sp. SID12488]NEA62435.1 hypothetical protein [Streptomyces sp. SID12488]